MAGTDRWSALALLRRRSVERVLGMRAEMQVTRCALIVMRDTTKICNDKLNNATRKENLIPDIQQPLLADAASLHRLQPGA